MFGGDMIEYVGFWKVWVNIVLEYYYIWLFNL